MHNRHGQVNWGLETLNVLRIIGKVLLRLLSYFFNVLLTVLLVCLITGIIVASVFAVYINQHLDLEIDPSTIVAVNRDSTTRIYYMKFETEEDRINRDGTLVEIEDQRLYSTDNALAVSYSQLPKDLINAFVAIEDKRFESHNGVDLITTGKAIKNFVFGGSGAGGSTITQQLIKNVTQEDEVTVQRKVEEIFRAINLEKVKSKEEIMEAYLNVIYMGNGCTGVQAAANFYFDKDVSELSLVECASLAAIVKNPSQFEPKYHNDNFIVIVNGEEVEKIGNYERRWVVLEEMKNNGFITEAECREAQAIVDLDIVYETDEDGELDDGMTIYNWYVDSMLMQLRDDLMELFGVDKTTAWNMIYYSGYKIVIPMDPEVQDVLEMVYENDKEYFPSVTAGLQPQSAMIVCDPYTGDVLGTVGGRGEKIDNLGFNRATRATRPPGSSIKPLSVYAPALDLGLITYGSAVDDTPVLFNEKLVGEATGDAEAIYSYTPYPYNYPNIFKGLTTINSAVTRSVNTIAMKVLQDLGVDYSFDFMKNELGFDSLIDSYTNSSGQTFTDRGLASLALGQPNFGVTLLEMTSAYCIFQNNGVYNSPNLYLYVEDANGDLVIGTRNNVTVGKGSESNIVISEETASIMTKMMKNVMDYGTGTACTLRWSVNVAGKTGTTSTDFDRYFVGYTPYYVGGVWTGYDTPQSLSSFGNSPALIVWDKVMTILHQKYIDEAAQGGEPLKTFDDAPGVVTATYCKYSGKLMTDACRLDPRGNPAETGYFTRSTVPTDFCDTHVIVRKDSSTGLIASDNCNPADCIEVGLIRVEDRLFPTQIYVEDAQYVYREMPESVKPAGWWGVPYFDNMLGEDEYCGSSYVETPYNAFCYKHCDYRPWGGNGPSEYSGYTPDNSDRYYVEPPDALPPDEDDIYGRDDEDDDDWFR